MVLVEKRRSKRISKPVKEPRMIKDPPKINESSLYSASDAIRLLGISRGKFYDAVRRGARRGGIDGKPRRDNGRLQFTGKEILRYWRG